MFHRYFKPFFCEFGYMLLASVTLLFVTSILTDVRAQEDTISFGVGQSVAVLEGFTADVTVKLSRPPANGAISVPIVVHSRHYVSAAERDDYQFVDRVTFNQGQTTKTITVEAVDDKFYEGNEWFILGFGELPEGWSAGSMDYVSIQIIDDDGFLIWFSRLDSTSGNELRIEEGQYSDEIELRLARRHDSGDDEFPNDGLTVELRVDAQNTSAQQEDYSFDPQSVEFNELGATRSIRVTAIDDKEDENTETIRLTYDRESLPIATGSSNFPQHVDVHIVDNDETHTIAFNRPANGPYEATEGGAAAMVTVTLEPAADRELVIPLVVHNMPGGATEEDYSFPADVTFDQGETSKAVTVTAKDDEFYDSGETVRLAFGSPLPAGVIADPAQAVADVTLLDDDPVRRTVAFVDHVYEATEGGAAAMVTVTLEPAADRELVIPLVVHNMPGGATEEDYSFPADVTFDQGETSKAVTVTAKDDEFYDSGETVRLAFGSPLPAGVIADPAQAVADVTLLDDDPVRRTVAFVDHVYEATEGGAAAMVTVTLEPAADRKLVIPLVVHNMPGGATEEDYSFPADVTFDQGETSKAVTVTAKDDEFYDSGETVRLAFGSPLPAGVIADPAQAVADVTLLDDDPVQAVVAEREAIESTLQAVATATAANITANVGARFSAARSGTNLTSLSLAGQSVTQPSTFEETGWNALWNQESRSRTLSSDELLRTTDFQIVLGASEGTQAQAAETWTFWGRGDLQFFSSEPSQGSSYDGDLRAGYFGLDTQVDDQWLAGIAVSRTMAEADYSLGISGADNDGTMDVTLTSLIPYVRFAPDSESELWAIVGAGQGAIENSRPGAASDRANLQETSDVAMLMASAGGRHAMALGDPLDWALLGDVGFGRVLTEDGVEAIAGLTVDTWQARVGVEGSYTVDTEDGGILTAFMEVAGRYDGGDEGEVGLELSPGIYIARPDTGFGLELRGRALVLHSAENYEEYGLSATASMTPRSDGTGLSLSLSPRWGDDTGGADTLWRDESLGLLGSSSSNRNTISLDARVGYGVRAMNGLLTPFSEFGVRDEDSQYWRIGARFNRIHTDPGTLNLELSGERRESLSGDPEHRVGVTSWLRF